MCGRLFTILFMVLFFSSGCSSNQDHADILQTVAKRSNSLNSRNINDYLDTVSTQYNDKGKNFLQLKNILEKNFREFEQISYKADKPTIIIDGAHAKSVANYRMKIKIHDREMELNGIEQLRLVKEAGGWKIVAGI